MSGPDLCEHGNDGSQPCAECAATDSHAPAAPAPPERWSIREDLPEYDVVDEENNHLAFTSTVQAEAIAVRDALNAVARGSAHRGAPEPVSTEWLYEIAERVRKVGSLDNAVSYLRGAVGGIAPAPCPYVRTSAEGTSYCTLAERVAPAPAPEPSEEGELPTDEELRRQYEREQQDCDMDGRIW